MMTEDLEDLIEHIRSTQRSALVELIKALELGSTVDRFRRVDAINNPALSWAVPIAKKTLIQRLMVEGDGSRRSLADVGDLLGISRQRVYQLVNPEPRRSQNGRTDRSSAI